jgi:hypothetical protein
MALASGASPLSHDVTSAVEFDVAQMHPEITARAMSLFGREDALMAQPFDIGQLQLSGEPFVVAAHVRRALGNVLSLRYLSFPSQRAVFWSWTSYLTAIN